MNQSGQQQGDAIVELIRQAQQPPPAQVHHVTTQVNVPGHDDNLDVLIAVTLGVVVFLLVWWIVGSNAHMSTLNDARTAGLSGLGVGLLYLAISNAVRWVR